MGELSFCINGRFLTQTLTGVQKFALAYTIEILKIYPETKVLCPSQTATQNLPFKPTPMGKLNGQKWEQIELPNWLKKHGSPLLLNFCNSAPLLYKNQIVTVHDVAFRVNPKWFNKAFGRWYNFLIPRIIAKSKHVLTVSEFSKSEICKYYGTNPDKISVVYNGVFFREAGKKTEAVTQLPEQFILCVSTFNPRKNLPFLLHAFSFAKLLNTTLIVAGTKNAIFKDDALEEQKNILFLEGINDDLLAELYKRAKLFIYPSLYEGFGLPILEALHFGCPVLASRLPVFEELFGDSIFYFDLNQKSELIEYLKKVEFTSEKPLFLSNVANGKSDNFNYATEAQKMIRILGRFVQN